MFSALRQYPLFVLVLIVGAASMGVPALYAAHLGEWTIVQNFVSYMLLLLALSYALGLAMMNRRARISARAQLVTVVLVYALMPVFLALPFTASIASIGPVQGYFEMLSSLTTTGATLINDPASIAPPLHLWRGLVAWQGGLFILVIAFSIMEPMNIGGFEIRTPVAGTGVGAESHGISDAGERIIRITARIAPAYILATFVLMLLLVFAGDRAFVAAIHAMSILSTSGISPVGGVAAGGAGRTGEAIMALFLLFAVSHRMFQSLTGSRSFGWIRTDVEVRIMLIAITMVPLLLFLRHWSAAFDVSAQQDIGAAARALWGSVFTILSFLTTTGFQSADWQEARNWSGLGTPGIVLLATAVAGGGVATTAGGVKLLRLYALYKHGARELERLIHPSSIGGAGTAARRFRREGGLIAWIFLMLFLMGIATAMMALSLDGVSFEDSIGLAIAAITNTGPAAGMLDSKLLFSMLDKTGLLVMGATMVFGRVEVLVLIALFNPSYWRR